MLCGGHALLIRKHGQWDIPKGKRKKREKVKRCALREVAEETGLDRRLLSVRNKLCRSGYITYYGSTAVYKTVDWFVMDYAGSVEDTLMPDISENIDLCVWVPLGELPERMRTARRFLRGEVTAAIEGALVGAVV